MRRQARDAACFFVLSFFMFSSMISDPHKRVLQSRFFSGGCLLEGKAIRIISDDRVQKRKQRNVMIRVLSQPPKILNTNMRRCMRASANLPLFLVFFLFAFSRDIQAQQQDPFSVNGGSILAMTGKDSVAVAVDKRFGSGSQVNEKLLVPTALRMKIFVLSIFLTTSPTRIPSFIDG
jgi:hypothetical protein